MFLNSFNYFRAVAIILIVAGHTYRLGGLKIDTFWEATIVNLISGGTSLFVFISGFLFHHVFYKRYTFKTFIFGKIKNVFIPYLFLGILPIAQRIYFAPDSSYLNGYFISSGKGILNEYLIPILKYYWTGGFMLAYWYIPFILITFLMSPLHIIFIKTSLKFQLPTILVFTIISVLIHRPIKDLSVFQSVVYFLPVYLIGIISSIKREFIYSSFLGKEIYLFGSVIFFAAIQALSGHLSSYHKDPFIYSGIDIMYFQKILLCFFFMVLLERFNSYSNKLLSIIAATSFSIFFTHPYLIYIVEKVFFKLGWSIEKAPESWSIYICLVILLIGISVGIALALKKIFPNFSRLIIGY
jgi:peptidoglycan/LPS O-acetylase OafA/YrhL